MQHQTKQIIEHYYAAFNKGDMQTYHVAAGAFFAIQSDKIIRITNYYNVKEWIHLITHS